MWFILLIIVAVVAAIGVLIYKHGFAKAWGIITTLVVAVAAAVAAFWEQLTGVVPPPV